MQEHGQQTRQPTYSLHLSGRLFRTELDLGQSVCSMPTRLHIAAEEHANTYINGSSDVAPFCISDCQVFYVTALRHIVFHKAVFEFSHTHARTQAAQAGWQAPGTPPVKAGWQSSRKMEEVKRERGAVTAWPTHTDKHIKVSPFWL